MTSRDERPAQPGRELHLSVQILSTLLFGAFAIAATAMAFAYFWPAGIVMAIILGWRGGFVPQAPAPVNPEEIARWVRALGPEARERSSGNASFDAYRADMLARLEDEQRSFETFLDRLRSAADRREFEAFMDERAHKGETVLAEAA
jgi:hypothetical protein